MINPKLNENVFNHVINHILVTNEDIQQNELNIAIQYLTSHITELITLNDDSIIPNLILLELLLLLNGYTNPKVAFMFNYHDNLWSLGITIQQEYITYHAQDMYQNYRGCILQSI